MSILRIGDRSPEVTKLQTLLKKHGYLSEPVTDEFDEVVKDSLLRFQSTHIGPDKKQLEVDGIVGNNTWWALENENSELQKNNISPLIPARISDLRIKVLNVAIGERQKGVHEEPMGSNWGNEIAKYGGKPGWPWCALFVNYCYKMGLGRYPFGTNQPSTYQMWKLGEAQKVWKDINYTPFPGDIFIMQYKNSMGKYTGQGHTGIVLRVDPSKKLINTIEGNCSNRVKVALRSIASPMIGFINIFGVGENPDFEKGVNAGNIELDNFSSTR